MNILIAPDSFKGSLSSREAAEAMAAGIQRALPDAIIRMVPMADGGEGTLDVVEAAWKMKGVRHCVFHTIRNPHTQYVDISVDYLMLADADADAGRELAVLESARFLGLNLSALRAFDVNERGSFGLGECLRTLVDQGVREIVIGLGGTATHDAGLGMLMALGMIALDKHGQPVAPNLAGLKKVAYIDFGHLLAEFKGVQLSVLCDVQAPLTGSQGATRMFAHQKGVATDELAQIESAMDDFATLCEAEAGFSCRSVAGSGAAGGVGFGLGLLGGNLVSGSSYLMKITAFKRHLAWADWLVTGEGCSDVQTLLGKLPYQLAVAAKQSGKPVLLLSGKVIQPEALQASFTMMQSVNDVSLAADDAMRDARAKLAAAAYDWAQTLEEGMNA